MNYIYISIKLLVTLLLTGFMHGFIGRTSGPTGAINWFGQISSDVEGRWKAETIFMVCVAPQLMYVGVSPAASFQHTVLVAFIGQIKKNCILILILIRIRIN